MFRITCHFNYDPLDTRLKSVKSGDSLSESQFGDFFCAALFFHHVTKYHADDTRTQNSPLLHKPQLLDFFHEIFLIPTQILGQPVSSEVERGSKFNLTYV